MILHGLHGLLCHHCVKTVCLIIVSLATTAESAQNSAGRRSGRLAITSPLAIKFLGILKKARRGVA
jgi:hypothetical protein